MMEHHFGIDAVSFISLHGTKHYTDRVDRQYDRTEIESIRNVLHVYDSNQYVGCVCFFNNRMMPIPQIVAQPTDEVILSDPMTGFRIINFKSYSLYWAKRSEYLEIGRPRQL